MSCCRSVGALATSNQFYSSGPLSGCGQARDIACSMQFLVSVLCYGIGNPTQRR